MGVTVHAQAVVGARLGPALVVAAAGLHGGGHDPPQVGRAAVEEGLLALAAAASFAWIGLVGGKERVREVLIVRFWG